jgi:hypothetical protein
VKAVDHRKEELVSAAAKVVVAGVAVAAGRLTFAVAVVVNKAVAADACVEAKVAVDAAVIVVGAVVAVAVEHVAAPQAWVVESELGLSVAAAVEPVDDDVVAVAGAEALLKEIENN